MSTLTPHADRYPEETLGPDDDDGTMPSNVAALDMGDVLELNVGWSSGNPFYYAYGFNIRVTDVGEPDGPVRVPSWLATEQPALTADPTDLPPHTGSAS